MKTEAEIAADEILDEYGPFDAPEALEVLADELMLAPDDYVDRPEAARAVAAELRRRVIRMRNS